MELTEYINGYKGNVSRTNSKLENIELVDTPGVTFLPAALLVELVVRKCLASLPLRVVGVSSSALVLALTLTTLIINQDWSLTQFHSFDFSQSRIGVKKCVFNKRNIKVCVSCC